MAPLFLFQRRLAIVRLSQALILPDVNHRGSVAVPNHKGKLADNRVTLQEDWCLCVEDA